MIAINKTESMAGAPSHKSLPPLLGISLQSFFKNLIIMDTKPPPMQQKTKLLTERVCHQCSNEHHLLYFRFIEHNIVYFFAKCTKCNYSYRQNCSTDKWKGYIEEHEQIQQLTKHHRIPRSHPNSSNESWNTSMVPLKKHQAYHTLFSNDDVYRIAEKLNRIWIDPHFKLVVEKRTEYAKQNNFLLTVKP